MKARKYKARPIICEAFCLEFNDDKPHRWIRELPEWFRALYEHGEAMITNSSQHGKYVTIKKQSGYIRAPEGSWIIRASEQNIFVMSSEEFNEHFALHDN